MNSKQRIERLEAKHRNRVSSVSSDFADAEQQFWAKLDAIAARMRALGQVPEPCTEAEIRERLALVKEDIQRQKELAKQPKAANWLKLQRKAH